jgi:hypothetical protein
MKDKSEKKLGELIPEFADDYDEEMVDILDGVGRARMAERGIIAEERKEEGKEEEKPKRRSILRRLIG